MLLRYSIGSGQPSPLPLGSLLEDYLALYNLEGWPMDLKQLAEVRRPFRRGVYPFEILHR